MIKTICDENTIIYECHANIIIEKRTDPEEFSLEKINHYQLKPLLKGKIYITIDGYNPPPPERIKKIENAEITIIVRNIIDFSLNNTMEIINKSTVLRSQKYKEIYHYEEPLKVYLYYFVANEIVLKKMNNISTPLNGKDLTL